jgi:hypothetical protein
MHTFIIEPARARLEPYTYTYTYIHLNQPITGTDKPMDKPPTTGVERLHLNLACAAVRPDL